MPNSTWDELETFIRAETGISKRKLLTRQLSLENDLDLTGDEAYYFMEKFFDKFKVQYGDFNFNRYFSGEGFNPFVIVGFIFSSKLRRKYDRAPLTVGMLEKAVEAGVWDSRALGEFVEN
jgi:hypothetical protein